MQKTAAKLILASTSPSRQALMKNAGLAFAAMRPEVDERAVEAPYLKIGATPAFLASLLAREKALAISRKAPDAFVIGGDQVMAFAGKPWSKPESREEAKAHLRRLSSRTHELISAVSIARNGDVLYAGSETATLHMRPLNDAFIDAYLADIPDAVLFSSGTYQLEGAGVRLFSKIEGDFFTILGLPMLMLLGALRELGAIDD
ncbi:Maf family protein [Martelella endophytica]|uniref:Nucleoside triphosphate pyrophosphatase n=1 Tax=Martelella endophytica TaxID=1486262 RepID=A0A0D5LVA4_MAREN|nr:Maf family protein [Martelella endophytica]AJY47936.1 septum formation inhibitor Maf [Martelella endophytica]